MNGLTYSQKAIVLVMRCYCFTLLLFIPFVDDLPNIYMPYVLFYITQISIDNLEKCITELVKHIFNNDTDALNARILVCIFWGLLRVQSSYVKQNSMVCYCLPK